MRARAKELYELRAKWRDQVFGDEQVTPAAFRVAYAIASYITMERTTQDYMDSGRIYVFPSQETLAHDANVATDTVRLSIKQLVGRGHIAQVRRGNQFTGANEYRILIPRRTITRIRPKQHRGNTAMLPRNIRDAPP